MNIILVEAQFINGVSVTLSWSDGQTSVGNLKSVDSEACIEKYSLQEETASIIIITGCEGKVKEFQMISSKYGQVFCTIDLDGSIEPMDFEERMEVQSETSIHNPDFESEFPDIDIGVSMATQIPPDLELEVVLYTTPSFREKASSLGYSDDSTLARQIFHQTSMAFLDESWGDTKIHLQANYVSLPVETDILDVWRLIVPKEQQRTGRLHSLLLGEGTIGYKNTGQNSTLGIAFDNVVCGEYLIGEKSQ